MNTQSNPKKYDTKDKSVFHGPKRPAAETTLKPSPVEIGSNGIPTISGSKDFEDFVYLLSHDLRASVRALLEVPQWIKEDLLDTGNPIEGSLSDNLGLMENHARRLDRMLVDLLAYSRVGRKQSMQSVYLDHALETVLLQIKLPKGFKVTTDLKCKTLKIGEQDILTLISALVSNAIKHHDKPVGHIEIRSKEEAGNCVICVQDDGPGIPEKYRERVFEAMTTLKPRDQVEGSGMGLAIVRKIVDLYGGSITWSPLDGDIGTRLEVRFPL